MNTYFEQGYMDILMKLGAGPTMPEVPKPGKGTQSLMSAIKTSPPKSMASGPASSSGLQAGAPKGNPTKGIPVGSLRGKGTAPPVKPLGGARPKAFKTSF